MSANAAAARRSPHFVLLQEFLRHPRATASVAASGHRLADRMAAIIPAGARRVVEIGAGTGAITAGILRRGIDPADLFVLEWNERLCNRLRARFPRTTVACGDARELVDLTMFWRGGCRNVDAVCSSLGLLNMPQATREAIVQASVSMLRPGGVFVQYTYGFRGPLGRSALHTLNLERNTLGVVWGNLPPATVYAYRRR